MGFSQALAATGGNSRSLPHSSSSSPVEPKLNHHFFPSKSQSSPNSEQSPSPSNNKHTKFLISFFFSASISKFSIPFFIGIDHVVGQDRIQLLLTGKIQLLLIRFISLSAVTAGVKDAS
ncbi:hypothetical protein C5167_041180 [Papaver somniferum]|uniref:Uncharacterized protein n=1 Tax=Papaver somniferum TaxID=3469 RepID=A0A4Y7IL87_PAPSO|nr:hypothetical protein C5167_041180 [Papaver somniferum]